MFTDIFLKKCVNAEKNILVCEVMATFAKLIPSSNSGLSLWGGTDPPYLEFRVDSPATPAKLD